MAKKMLIDVAKKEGFELDSGSAELLAILADGSFRDALGELQKVINFSNVCFIECIIFKIIVDRGIDINNGIYKNVRFLCSAHYYVSTIAVSKGNNFKTFLSKL